MKKSKLKVAFDNMIIEPQAGDYEFLSMPPGRIGDIAHIAPESRMPRFGEGVFVPCARVILLADKSGRRWLVEWKQ